MLLLKLHFLTSHIFNTQLCFLFICLLFSSEKISHVGLPGKWRHIGNLGRTITSLAFFIGPFLLLSLWRTPALLSSTTWSTATGSPSRGRINIRCSQVRSYDLLPRWKPFKSPEAEDPQLTLIIWLNKYPLRTVCHNANVVRRQISASHIQLLTVRLWLILAWRRQTAQTVRLCVSVCLTVALWQFECLSKTPQKEPDSGTAPTHLFSVSKTRPTADVKLQHSTQFWLWS